MWLVGYSFSPHSAVLVQLVMLVILEFGSVGLEFPSLECAIWWEHSQEEQQKPAQEY